MFLIRHIATACLTIASLCAQAQTASGFAECSHAGKPDLKFKPQTVAGYYVKKSGAFNVTFFADKLSNEELRYWAATETYSLDGLFEGKPFESDTAKEKRNDALKARTVRVWGELKEHSKHEEKAWPAVHQLADFQGMQLTACSNFGYVNAGLSEDALKDNFKEFNIPTPNGAAANQTAQLEFNYKSGKPGHYFVNIALKGVATFFVVDQERKD